MENENALLEKVMRIVSTVEITDNQDGFCYFEEMMIDYYTNDPDFPIIREKMENLISLLNTKLKGDKDEYEAFLDLDFETEIFHMI